MEKVKMLWKLPVGRDWLRGKLVLVPMSGTMFSKSLTQFSVDGWGCVPSIIYLRPNYGGGNEDNKDLLQKVSAPNPAAGHHWLMPPMETPGHSPASLAQFLVGSQFLSPGSWCAQGFGFALAASVSQSCVSSRGSVVGLMATSPNRAYAIPKSTAPRVPAAI